jgi:hypothetical protein
VYTVNGWQTPAEHVPPRHEWPQEPQLDASLPVVSTHVFDVEQYVGVAEGHAHIPFEHAFCGAEQGCAHPPQFIGSVDVSTHVPLQF